MNRLELNAGGISAPRGLGYLCRHSMQSKYELLPPFLCVHWLLLQLPLAIRPLNLRSPSTDFKLGVMVQRIAE